jgi:hypothetical protein
MSRRRPPRIPGTRHPRTLFVLPEIPDELEPAEKNALAIRNACATEGVCRGCNTVGEIHPDAHDAWIWHYVFRHEPWCPVLADGEAA